MSAAARQVLDSAALQRCLRRLASEIVDGCPPEVAVTLVGIQRGGVSIAARLAGLIRDAEGTAPGLGSIDITLYRDDLYTGLESPSFGGTDLPQNSENSGIVLVDDVLFTGRTVRAALGVVHDYGRPRWIKLAALIDRGHRELPIQADFVGRVVETELCDRITVHAASAADDDDGVFVETRR